MRERPVPKLDINGILVLNKPSGPTSAGCLNRIKRVFKPKKIGHAGTLDPMAEGVLLVLLGAGTKLGQYLLSGEKIYRGRMVLGIETDTYDIQGAVVNTKDASFVTTEMVLSEIEEWKKLTSQEVPAYSAAKHNGKPLYALAREGKDVPKKEKSVRITDAVMLEADLPKVEFKVACSAGTYIRSLVHSLGTRMGCGATLDMLVREYSHPFGLPQAVSLDEVLDSPDLPGMTLPLVDALPHWTKVALTPSQARLVENGAALPKEDVPEIEDAKPGDTAFFLDSEQNPLALVELKEKNGRLAWAILRGLWN